jgi:hypothetical protein
MDGRSGRRRGLERTRRDDGAKEDVMPRTKSRTARKAKNGSDQSREARTALEAVKMRRYLAFVRAIVGATTRGSR